MLRFKARVTVYKKDEQTNHREIDFDSTPELEQAIRNEIEFRIQGIHMVDNDGNVYVLGVSTIEQIS